MMLILLDSNIRNSVCTPAKLPCRRVEVGYEITINGFYILMSLVGIQSTSDGKKIWKIKLKIGERITKHMRVCWKHFVDEDFVPLVWTHCPLV
jgi:hypothetical protein